ncbi:universal stress protein [Ilumatobacter nonamiensis]|uniref:universal stress protein n=1 Tax=Ilumatobacter nonamiensis TaxID=467093 RepID=UPI00034B6232|nr:universal stress protein [Ilumatobacter nonamiensis]
MTDHSAPVEPSANPSARRLLLATDGSEHANAALRAGIRLVEPGLGSLLVTVVPTLDPSIVVGSGHAGPVMTFADEQQLIEERDRDARRAVDEAAAFLGLSEIEIEILGGDPGAAICERAEEAEIDLIVIGTSGTGGFKRALLGSVSDYVVRHAPCPVITSNPD